MAGPGRKPRTKGELTERELQVLRRTVLGEPETRVARHLRISTSAVKNALRSARWSLDAVNTVHLAVIAIGRGLLPCDIAIAHTPPADDGARPHGVLLSDSVPGEPERSGSEIRETSN